jgi:hypothetical protein
MFTSVEPRMVGDAGVDQPGPLGASGLSMLRSTHSLEDLFPSFLAHRQQREAAAGQEHQVAAGPLRAFPATPFYSLFRKLQIDVEDDSAERTRKAHRGEAPDGEPQGWVGLPASTVNALAQLRTCDLATIVERHCTYYAWTPRNAVKPRMSGQRGSAFTEMDVAHRRDRYVQYIDAVCDAYRGVTDGEPTAERPFVGFYLICRDHPRWKNFAALLFREAGAEVSVAVASECVAFQRFVTKACRDAGVSADHADWIDGALLATAGHRAPGQACPVHVVIDALLNIQDASPTFDTAAFAAASTSVTWDPEGSPSVAVAPLICDYVSIYAPTAFRGGECRRFRCHKRRATEAASAQSWIVAGADGDDARDVLLPSAVHGIVHELVQRGQRFSVFFTPVIDTQRRGAVDSGEVSTRSTTVFKTLQKDARISNAAVDSTLTADNPHAAFSRLSSFHWLAPEDHPATDEHDADATDAVFVPLCIRAWPQEPPHRRFYIQNVVHRFVQ